jgi:hypothetical protein
VDLKRPRDPGLAASGEAGGRSWPRVPQSGGTGGGRKRSRDPGGKPGEKGGDLSGVVRRLAEPVAERPRRDLQAMQGPRPVDGGLIEEHLGAPALMGRWGRPRRGLRQAQ